MKAGGHRCAYSHQRSADDQLGVGQHVREESHALVGDKNVHKLRADVIIIRIHDVYALDELPFLEAQHAAWIREVQSPVLVV